MSGMSLVFDIIEYAHYTVTSGILFLLFKGHLLCKCWQCVYTTTL